MTKPTNEQIKEFWEWCGVEPVRHIYRGDFPDRENYETVVELYLPIDLNNLFKYAVPFLHNKLGDEDCYNLMIRWIRDVIFGKDPALALFWVVRQALKEGV